MTTRSRSIPTFALITLLVIAETLLLAGCHFSVDVLKKKPKPATVPSSVPQAHIAAEVPKDAQLMGQGTDPIRFTAAEGGTVYVFNRDDRNVSLQYDLVAGETFSIEPAPGDRAKFTADRHTSAGAGTIPASAGGYEVYFQPRATTTTSPAEMAPGS